MTRLTFLWGFVSHNSSAWLQFSTFRDAQDRASIPLAVKRVSMHAFQGERTRPGFGGRDNRCVTAKGTNLGIVFSALASGYEYSACCRPESDTLLGQEDPPRWESDNAATRSAPLFRVLFARVVRYVQLRRSAAEAHR